jgi:hypothetical protein
MGEMMAKRITGSDPNANFWMESKVTGKYHYFYGDDPEPTSACGGSSISMGKTRMSLAPESTKCCIGCRSIWSTIDTTMRRRMHNREGRNFDADQVDEGEVQ